MCCLPAAGEVDIATVCTPCQPYSVMRDSRQVPPEEHKLFNTTFGSEGSLITYATTLKPQVLVVEQVEGLKKVSKVTGKTYKQKLMDSILAIPNEADTGVHFAGGVCVPVNADLCSPTSRPRYLGRSPAEVCSRVRSFMIVRACLMQGTLCTSH